MIKGCPVLRLLLVVQCALALGTMDSQHVTLADEALLTAEQASRISFREDVWPILNRHCRGCHTASDAKGGLSLDTVADMLKGGAGGPLFAQGKPDESLVMDMISGEVPEMPKKQPALSVAKVQLIRGWIAGGAIDDSTESNTEPVVVIPQTYQFAPSVTSISLSPDGKLVAAACRSEVVLIEVETDAPPRRLPTACDLLTHVEFSPDGKLLAAVGGSPSRSGEIYFFNPVDGAIISSRRIGHDTLFRGSFSPDSTAIAVGGTDGAAHIVPVDVNAAVRLFPLHSDWVLDVAWTPDGKMLVTGGRDKATKICSIEDGRLLRSADMSTELIGSVACTADFAFASGRARTLNGYELKIALSGIGVTGAGNDAQPVTNRDQYVKAMESQPGDVLDMGTSLDRKLLAIAGAYAEVRIYKTDDRQRVALIGMVPATINAVALSADGVRLAIGSRHGQVQIYEVAGGKLLKSLIPVPVANPRETIVVK